MQLYGQLNPGKPIPSFPALLKGMITHEGFFSIYKGIDAGIGRQMVYGTARIGLHRTFSDLLVEYNKGEPISFMAKALSGMASGSVAVCIGTPFDIALVRMQADSMAPLQDRRNYKNVFDVSILRIHRILDFASSINPSPSLYLTHIFVAALDLWNIMTKKALVRTTKEEGVIALYKGLVPNVLRGMAMNVGMLACYDQAKEGVATLLNDPMTDGPSLSTKLLSSAIAVRGLYFPVCHQSRSYI